MDKKELKELNEAQESQIKKLEKVAELSDLKISLLKALSRIQDITMASIIDLAVDGLINAKEGAEIREFFHFARLAIEKLEKEADAFI